MSKADVHTWFEYGIHYQTSTVACIGDVDEALADRVVRGLWVLDLQARPITVLLSTGGGCVNAGGAIMDAIRRCDNPVTILGTGEVQSMGVYILQAGDHRLLTPRCQIMAHIGTQSMPEDHVRNVEAAVAAGRAQDAELNDLLLSRIREVHPNYTRRQLNRILEFDHYLTAQAAVDLGLADGIKE